MSKQIIEVKGVKMEVDLREATAVETFKVGDNVKVLMPSQYAGGKHQVYPGVIAGFEAFKALPTVIVAYLKLEYSTATLQFVCLNAESEDVEIVRTDEKYLPLEKNEVLAKMAFEIEAVQAKIDDLQRKRQYFLDHFEHYFKDVPKQTAAAPDATQ